MENKKGKNLAMRSYEQISWAAAWNAVNWASLIFSLPWQSPTQNWAYAATPHKTS